MRKISIQEITGKARLAGMLCALAVGVCGCASQNSSGTAAVAETAADENSSAQEAAQEASDPAGTQTESSDNSSAEAAKSAASAGNSSLGESSSESAAETDSESASEEDPAIAARNQTIFFTVDGTTIYLDETLQELVSSGLSFTYHDNTSGADVPVDEAYCRTSYNGSVITITVTDSSGNPVSVSLWNRWTDEEPETFGELTVMNIGIAEPAPTSWSKASTGPYGIYIGMPQSDLISAAGEPESHVQFVKSPEWLYTGDNYTMTINVSSGVVKGIWIENAVKTSHAQ